MSIFMVIIMLTFCDIAAGMWIMLMIYEKEKSSEYKKGSAFETERRALR